MEVNGVEATGIRDTGASIIIIVARLIREEDRTGLTSLIILADANHSICCPTALVNLRSPFACGRLEVVVMEHWFTTFFHQPQPYLVAP